MSERNQDFFKPTPEEIARAKVDAQGALEAKQEQENFLSFEVGEPVVVQRSGSGLEAGWSVADISGEIITVQKSLPTGEVMEKRYRQADLFKIQEGAELQVRNEITRIDTPEGRDYAEKRERELDAHYGITEANEESVGHRVWGIYHKPLGQDEPSVYHYNLDASRYNSETGIVKLVDLKTGNIAYGSLEEFGRKQEALRAEAESYRLADETRTRKAGHAGLEAAQR